MNKYIINPLTGRRVNINSRLGKVISRSSNYKGGAAIATMGQTNMMEFFDAAKKGDLEILKALILTGINVNITDKNGNTALTIAARNGNENIVEFLTTPRALRAGVDINKTGDSEYYELTYTALMESVIKGHVSIVNRLIKSGADVNKIATNSTNITALWLAVENDRIDIVTSILTVKNTVDNDVNESLIHAAFKGKLNITTMLLDFGADINYKDSGGYTPLMNACLRAGNSEIIKILLNRGARVNDVAPKGETALMITVFENNDNEMISLLLDANPDISIKDYKGKTVIDIAVTLNKYDAITMLQEYEYLHRPITQNDYVKECNICMNSRPLVVFAPCGHHRTCLLCYNRLNPKKCPDCRTPIAAIVTTVYKGGAKLNKNIAF